MGGVIAHTDANTYSAHSNAYDGRYGDAYAYADSYTHCDRYRHACDRYTDQDAIPNRAHIYAKRDADQDANAATTGPAVPVQRVVN